MSGWAALIFILVLLAGGLLSVPITFKARGCLRTEEWRLELRLAWGWGLLAGALGIDGSKTTFGLQFAGIALPVPRKKPETARAKKNRKTTGREGERSGLNLPVVFAVLNRKLLTVILAYFSRLYKSLRLRFQLNGIYGADDPALTGLIAGLIAALPTEHFNLDLNVDFGETIVDVAGETSGRIVPFMVLWFTISLFLAGPVRRLWWFWLKTKFIKRKPKEAAHYV